MGFALEFTLFSEAFRHLSLHTTVPSTIVPIFSCEIYPATCGINPTVGRKNRVFCLCMIPTVEHLQKHEEECRRDDKRQP